jgi:DNA polymerase III delta subunit
MLYAIYGSDGEKVRVEARKFIEVARSREPNLAFVRITPDTWDASVVSGYLEAQGLFVEKVLVVLDGVLEGETKDEAFSLLKECGSSHNVFLVIAGALSKTTLTKLEKHATKTYSFDQKTDSKKEEWNIFALGNAWERGDTCAAWVLYRDARARGMEPEVLAGILHATMRRGIEKGGRTRPRDAYMSAARELTNIYHAARQGVWELDVALEHFLTK